MMELLVGPARSRSGLVLLSMTLLITTGIIAGGSCIGCRHTEADTAKTTTFTASSVNASPSPGSSASPDKPSEVVVYVTGAVNRPGLYRLHTGDRVADALQLAGGFKADAATEALNLAEHAQDGTHLHFPTKSEYHPVFNTRSVSSDSDSSASLESSPASHRGQQSGSSHVSNKFKNPGDGTINLNTATEAELERIPRCGPEMAARILEYRQQIGHFTDVRQLQDVKGVGDKTFAKMQPFVTVE